MKILIQKYMTQFWALNILHVFNDGYKAIIFLLIPFVTKEFSLSLTEAGFLGTIVNTASVLCALPAGYLAKKIGGIKALLIALFLYGGGFFLTSFAEQYFILIFTFSLIGIGFGLFHPISLALVAKWSTKQNRGKLMGNFTAIGELGRVIFATPFTLFIVAFGWHSTIFLYTFLVLGIGLISYFFFLKNKEHVTVKQEQQISISLKEIITHKQFMLATLANFFDDLANAAIVIFLPFLLLFRGVEPGFLGVFAAVFFLGNFGGKLALGRIIDRFNATTILIAAEILMATCIFLLANTTMFFLILVLVFFLGMFSKGTIPIIQTMISESADHHGNFEKTFGVSRLIGSIATALSPIILGAISDSFGIVAAFAVMAGFALLTIIPAIAFHQSKRGLTT